MSYYLHTILFFTFLLITSCSNPSVEVSLDGFTQSRATDLAKEELTTLWGKALSTEKKTGSYKFILKLDTACQNGTFAYAMTGDKQFLLRGGDHASVLHAVHSLLEEVGYTFDITGVTVPEAFQLAAVQGINKTVTPHVRWRGIRQHVNFPMDISSYPIEEAKEYVKNLMRLRFNKLTVHSYPGQWYEVAQGDSVDYAGNFFYGDRHYMYGNNLLKANVRFNDSTFCMPEANACFNDKKAKSAVAVRWMQQLIGYAKEIGMHVQFSFEPRITTVENAVATARQIIQTYPDIDEFELITEETGGWGPSCTAEEVKKTLHTYFAPEIINDTLITAPIRPVQSDLNHLYTQIGILSNTIKELNKDAAITDKVSEIKLGIYCTMPGYAPAAYRLASTSLPENKITIMPSHGSDGVARNFDAIVTSKDDMAKTEIYSWIEFDGLMYLQQNGTAGIAELIKKMDKQNEGKQLYSILFNHWRTAENRTSARFASLATLYGETSPQEFYHAYASRLGITDKELFSKAMIKINEVDSYATTALGNIGFCWVGAWRNGGSYSWMSTENIEKASQMYMEAGEMFTTLLTATTNPAGKEYLSFLGNRTLCSVIYLKAFREATEIRTIVKDANGTVSDSEKKRAIEICNHALLIFDQYMEAHARLLPDRGSEGTLVSVWNAPIRGLKVLRSKLGGIPIEEMPHSDQPIDAPPLPIFYESK